MLVMILEIIHEYSRIFRRRYANNVHINFNKFHNNNTFNSLTLFLSFMKTVKEGLSNPPSAYKDRSNNNVVKKKKCFQFTT